MHQKDGISKIAISLNFFFCFLVFVGFIGFCSDHNGLSIFGPFSKKDDPTFSWFSYWGACEPFAGISATICRPVLIDTTTSAVWGNKLTSLSHGLEPDWDVRVFSVERRVGTYAHYCTTLATLPARARGIFFSHEDRLL